MLGFEFTLEVEFVPGRDSDKAKREREYTLVVLKEGFPYRESNDSYKAYTAYGKALELEAKLPLPYSVSLRRVDDRSRNIIENITEVL